MEFLKRKQKGFTLIELIVVIAVIAILVAIVIVAINPIKILNDTKDSKARTEANQVKTALQLYYNDNTRYPDTTEFGSSGTIPLVPVYIKQIPSTVLPSNYSVPSGTYLLRTSVFTVTSDDTSSSSKCGGSAGNYYYVCPD